MTLAAGAWILVAIVLAYAAYSDLRFFIIPDWISIVLLGTFIAAGLKAGFSLRDWMMHGGVALAVFLLLAALFAAGLMGGGDVKLMTALACHMGTDMVFRFLLLTSIAGGIYAVMRLVIVICTSKGGERKAELHAALRGDIPYGVAIALAALYTIPQTQIFIKAFQSAT